MTARLLSALLLIAVSACGYSNAMYNARRGLSDGERAARRGEGAAARTAYGDVVETAAAAFRKDPEGPHAAEALFLVGRARMGLDEHEEARAAFARAAALAAEPELRAAAFAYAGAAELELERHAGAEALLDSALALGIGSDALRARTHLWRARSRLARGAADARDDIERAAREGGVVAREARLYAARHAITVGDSVLLAESVRALFAGSDLPHSSAVAAMAHDAATRWSPGYARTLLDLETGGWPAAARDTLLVVRAELLARAGDTAAAVDAARRAADRLDGAAADRARMLAARWQLQTATAPADLERVHALLAPAAASPDALELRERLRRLDALIGAAGEEADAVALFAAGELARDELEAPGLARRLFLDYARLAPDAVWAPKAMLAAAALGGIDAGIAASLHAASGNVYVRAMNGAGDAEALAAAEAELERALDAIRQTAADDSAGGGPGLRTDTLSPRAAAADPGLRGRVAADTLPVSRP